MILALLLLSQLLAGEVPEPQKIGNSCQTAAAFSPNGNVANVLISVLNRARSSIYVAMYTFTSAPVADALIAAKQRGVTVSVKLDETESQGKSQMAVIGRLKAAHIPVQISALKALQHDKYAVVDDQIVVTGSYNWTASAEHWNRENLVVLTCPWLAALYADNWKTIK